jgi:hypothetical protein
MGKITELPLWAKGVGIVALALVAALVAGGIAGALSGGSQKPAMVSWIGKYGTAQLSAISTDDQAIGTDLSDGDYDNAFIQADELSVLAKDYTSHLPPVGTRDYGKFLSDEAAVGSDIASADYIGGESATSLSLTAFNRWEADLEAAGIVPPDTLTVP